MNYPPPTDPAPAAVRHRRSERHRQEIQTPPAYQQPSAYQAPPAYQQPANVRAPSVYQAPQRTNAPARSRRTEPRQARRKPAGRAASGGMTAGQWAALALLLVGMMAAVAVWLVSGWQLRGLRDARAREEQAYQEKVNRYLTAQSQYRRLIEQYAAQYGVDPAFVSAIIMEESSYDPRAVSSKGARGLMQFMPKTFDWVRKNCGYRDADFDVVFQPEPAIKMGCYLLNYIIGQIGTDDPFLVACSYHAGWADKGVGYWLKNYCIDQVAYQNELLRGAGSAYYCSTDGAYILNTDRIPDNTRKYARRVLNSYAIYLQNYYEVHSPGADPGPDVSAGAGNHHGSIPVSGYDLGKNQVYQSPGGGGTGISVPDGADL